MILLISMLKMIMIKLSNMTSTVDGVVCRKKEKKEVEIEVRRQANFLSNVTKLTFS